MDTAALVILVMAVLAEFVVGIALNLHIPIVYIGNLKNGLPVGPANKVHLAKAPVNVCLQVTMTVQCILFVFWPHLYFTKELYLWIVMMLMFLFCYTYWLTAVLCVYYWTTITTGGHHVIAWLKRSLSSYLLHILLGSGLGSLAISIPAFWFCSTEPAGNRTNQSTDFNTNALWDPTYRISSSILGCFMPLTIVFVSTVFTSWSLLGHMWRMKQNNPGFTRSKFQTQMNATKTMILFLLSSVIYSVIQMFFMTFLLSSSNDFVIMIWFITLSWPISEAAIIIQSSGKLRSSLLGKFFDRNRRNMEVET